jgi:hypothetical protein
MGACCSVNKFGLIRKWTDTYTTVICLKETRSNCKQYKDNIFSAISWPTKATLFRRWKCCLLCTKSKRLVGFLIWNRHRLKNSRNRYQSWLLDNFRYTRRSENGRVVTIRLDALRYLPCLFRKFSRVLEKR